ncbi:MAG TPA: PIN domain-containing protein [Candidatus Limnocylindrales bacterium]|nr:PIN domain-containing protein [Candidatus Limnocylindrales bacterium]
MREKPNWLSQRQIIDELERILLTDGKFELPREDVALYSEIILSQAELVCPAFTLNVIVKDPADDRILERAVEGEVDYLVSGNKHLLDVKEFRG